MERGLGAAGLTMDPAARDMLIDFANGDARRALNTLEIAAGLARTKTVTMENVQEALQQRTLLYDKSGEEHFNLISALHKSLRNSDVDAALYWLARMLASGEDPLYVARRMVRFASEDIGLADPQALALALHAKEAYDFLGSPEGELALAEAVVYMAAAPKSNRIYTAYGAVQKEIERSPHEPVPLHIRNAVTSLMKEIGYGKDYRYAHDSVLATTDMETMPERLRGRKYYEPGELGFEKEIRKRIDWWDGLKARIRADQAGKSRRKRRKRKARGSVRRAPGRGVPVLSLLEQVIDLPADVVRQAADTGLRGRGDLLVGDLVLEDLLDDAADLVQQDVVDHSRLSAGNHTSLGPPAQKLPDISLGGPVAAEGLQGSPPFAAVIFHAFPVGS